MKRSDVAVLNQTIASLEENVTQLEKFYSAKDYTQFNNTKRMILELNKKIQEILG